MDQVPGFGAPQGTIFFFIPLQKKLEQLRVVFQPVGLDHLAENDSISLPGRRGDIKPISHPAQKGVIHQPFKVQVSGKNEQLLERDLDLLAGVQGQVIGLPLQRDDPAVQQVQRIDPLPAEVVDNQGPAIGL